MSPDNDRPTSSKGWSWNLLLVQRSAKRGSEPMKKEEPIIQPHLGPTRDRVGAPLRLSEKAARRALAQAMILLGRAQNPAQVFRENKDIIITSLVILGRGDEAKELAAVYSDPASP